MNPIQSLIGQDQAKRVMTREVWKWENQPERIAETLLFVGPSSAGKTECARTMAKAADLPFLELQPQSIGSANDLMDEIQSFEIPIELLADYQAGGPPPRICILLDEFHQCPRKTEQALLKALEPKDRLLVSEDGRKLDTSRFVFMLATTEMGDLFDAIITRCVTIRLGLYSKAEVSQIVSLNFPKWNKDACDMVAHYCGAVPREALSFAGDVQTDYDRTGNNNFSELCKVVAEDRKIDSHGMTEQRLSLLTALGNGPISRSRIRHICNVKDAELQRYILPPMLITTPDQEQPLVSVSNKGYCITPAGLEQLDIRSIPNRGDEAIPKSVRTLFDMGDEPEPLEQPGTVRMDYFQRRG